MAVSVCYVIPLGSLPGASDCNPESNFLVEEIVSSFLDMKLDYNHLISAGFPRILLSGGINATL